MTSLKAIVERGLRELAEEGRTTAAWLARIERLRAQGCLHGAPMADLLDELDELDEYRQPDGPSTDDIVTVPHEGRKET